MHDYDRRLYTDVCKDCGEPKDNANHNPESIPAEDHYKKEETK